MLRLCTCFPNTCPNTEDSHRWGPWPCASRFGRHPLWCHQDSCRTLQAASERARSAAVGNSTTPHCRIAPQKCMDCRVHPLHARGVQFSLPRAPVSLHETRRQYPKQKPTSTRNHDHHTVPRRNRRSIRRLHSLAAVSVFGAGAGAVSVCLRLLCKHEKSSTPLCFLAKLCISTQEWQRHPQENNSAF